MGTGLVLGWVPKLETMAKAIKAGSKKQMMREGMGLSALDP